MTTIQFPSQSLLRLNKFRSLSLSSCIMQSKHLNISVIFQCTLSIYQHFFGAERSQTGRSVQGAVSQVWSRVCLHQSASCAFTNATFYVLSPCQEMLHLQTHIEFGLHYDPLACFMVIFSPRCRTCVCLCWISKGSCWPILAARWDLSEWQPWLPVCELVSLT